MRRSLKQSTHSKVANSTASRLRRGPRRPIASVLWRLLIVSAKAWLLRRLFGFVGIADATDEGFDASVGKAFHVPNGNDF
ncbi:hypothetical protein FH063_004523 [Azospirillum argentinense]|uniref:Uncharacterized protein n=1 Tax=Azospirillum argentinense TaxID=2970906 RepID=A0A5B0KWM5_9PROT|nr:hypothetical protein FH063_004523 [Azospirillum argentinense]